MRWFSTVPNDPERLESIRRAFAALLNEADTPSARALMLRIQYAGNAERLWHLRPEAMDVLASLQGEARAREALARISALFQDVLPGGLASGLRTAGAAPTTPQAGGPTP